MVKLLGAACILGAGAWAWRRGQAERRRELDTLADLIALLDRMAEEIRLRRTSLAPLGQSWRSAAEALPLRREDRQALAAMGDALQGDDENICKAILLTNKSLRKDLELTRDRRQETEKRSAALWLSGAALLVILLI